MLDHMSGAHLVERPVAKGIREMIEIAEHVGTGKRIPVNTD
jgi:hypothetical protein